MMKYSLMLLGICVVSHADAETVCRVTGVAPNDVLNMRASGYTNQPIVDILAPNASNIPRFECRHFDDTNWCLVAHPQNHTQGWVAERYLNCDTGTTHSYPNLTSINAIQDGKLLCDKAPYCTVIFDDKAYFYPVGWLMSAPYYSDPTLGSQGMSEQNKSATIITYRQRDNAKVYVNGHGYHRPDCDYNMENSVCFEASFQPITERERKIFGGAVNAPATRNELPSGKLLDYDITIIVKALGDTPPVQYWHLMSDAAWYQLQLLSDGDMPNDPDYWPYVVIDADAQGIGRTTTNLADEYGIHAFNRDIAEPTFNAASLRIEPQPKTQCFLIPPHEDNIETYHELLLRYQLPHYYRMEGVGSGYSDGTQVVNLPSNSDEYGHGPDLELMLAPVPCARLNP